MRNKNLKIPIYSGDLVIHHSENWDEVNKKYKIDLGIETCGIVFQHITKTGYTHYVVAFRQRPARKIIVHEAVHLVNILFKRIGFHLDVDNDEAQAYLTEWFYAEIEDFFY